MSKISDEQVKNIFEKNLCVVSKTAECLGVSEGTVYYRLKKLNVALDYNKKKCNENFFSKDTEDSFYWAGFIAADGNVHLNRDKYKRLRIELSVVDKKHLTKFIRAISYEGTISYNMKKNSCYICIRSDKIFDDLARFGIVPNKTKKYSIPNEISKHIYFNHFLRGYADGDGSFYYKKSKKDSIQQISFNIVGTKSVMNTVSQILSSKCSSVQEKKPHKIKNLDLYRLSYSGNNSVSNIRRYLYSDSHKDIRLERKYNKSFSPEKKIMGLDLSLNSTGYCILTKDLFDKNKQKYKDYYLYEDGYGIIQPNGEFDLGMKLSLIEKNIRRLIRKHRPSHIVIEDIFKGRNVQTFKYLSMLRGVVIKLIYEEGFEDRIRNFSASEVRNILESGKSKEDTFEFITKNCYNFNFNYDYHNDIVDSIALAIVEIEGNEKSLRSSGVTKKRRRKRNKKSL